MDKLRVLKLKLQDRWLDIEISILDWLLLQTFLLSNKERQREIIDNHIVEFFHNNDIAQHINTDGDFVGSLYYSSKSLEHLGKVAIYCEKINMDAKTLLNEYQEKIRKL